MLLTAHVMNINRCQLVRSMFTFVSYLLSVQRRSSADTCCSSLKKLYFKIMCMQVRADKLECKNVWNFKFRKL